MTLSTSHLLYLIFALGGAAVYLLLPGGKRSIRAAGALFGLAALVALVVVLAVRVLAPDAGSVYFYLFALIALAAAARVITHQRPVYSALYFVLVVMAVAALLVLQQAEFLAVALIIIYAGAILVTYVFVMMLADQRGDTVYDRLAREPLWGVLAGFVLLAAVAGRVEALAELPAPTVATATTVSDNPAADEPAGLEPETALAEPSNTLAVGQVVMTRFVVVLEIAGVLLLVAMVGAVALSRKHVPSSEPASPQALGEVGKKVKPF